MSSCLENVYNCPTAQEDPSRVTVQTVSAIMPRRFRIIFWSPRLPNLKARRCRRVYNSSSQIAHRRRRAKIFRSSLVSQTGENMGEKKSGVVGRREVLRNSALALGATLLADSIEAYPKAVVTNSSPSTLKITDLRVAIVAKPGPSPCPIIRIDTNQDVYGLGEVRDGASPSYALFLKSRILGENPLQLDRIFRKIKQFGGHARQGGGVSAIEMALWDIAGKVYNAPVYALVGGGKFRDKIRIYADTTESKDPKIYAQRMKERKEVMGLTWLKMDLGIEMVADTPGTLTTP